MTDDSKIFYHSNDKAVEQKLSKLRAQELKEGIVIGVTSAILMKSTMKTTCLFAETHSALPDSKAAAKTVEVLDKYLGINLDTKPLLNQAEKLEGKLKDILKKNQEVIDAGEKKQLSYVG